MRKVIFFAFLLSIIIHSFFCTSWAKERAMRLHKKLRHYAPDVGKYRALFIGINDYEDPDDPDLKTAVYDVKELKEILLKNSGFAKAMLLLGSRATKKNIDECFRLLIRDIGPKDSLLIYCAGHGELDKDTGGGWWVPYDAKPSEPNTYLDNAIIKKYIKAMKGRHVLLISDSFYSGSLLGKTRALPTVIDYKFYLELYNAKSRWGMTSGNRTPDLDIGSGGHSFFAYHLIKNLKESKEPYLTPRQNYARIGPLLPNNFEQMPLCKPMRNTGDEGGEFVFTRTHSMSFQVNFVYRRRGKGGLRPIENESILHSGDHYKIVFTPDNDCYVYIFQVDSARQIYQLFPMREFRGVRLDNLNPVNGRRTYTLPARNKAFRLDMQVGRERIYFIASKKRNKELERLYQDLTEARKQAKEMQEEDAQAKLRWYFKRRGVGGIVTNRSLNVFWEESQDVFSILEQRLEELCEDCIHVVEFIHR